MRHSRPDYNRIQDPAGLIPDDEPVFFLRAQDRAAAETVRYWAETAEFHGASPEMVQNALAQADAMEAWATKKVPDLPPSIVVVEPNIKDKRYIDNIGVVGDPQPQTTGPLQGRGAWRPL